MLKAVAFQTICAWILASIVYQVGSRIESGVLNIANVVVGGIIIAVIVGIIISKTSKKDGECSSCPYCDNCKK